MKSPTGLYCANSQKRTKSLLLPSSLTIQANLFAKNTHALRQKQTVIPSFWPQAVGANLFAKNAHALRQKQTVIPQLLAAGRRSELVRESCPCLKPR
ncbi:hypothetical protein DNF23_53105 [Pseudomonas syringae pv. pisi]